MVRTIIQLTEEQAKVLKERANSQGVSVSALVRQGVDMVLSSHLSDAEMRRRAKAAVGFINDEPNMSVDHDKYLSQAYSDGEA